VTAPDLLLAALGLTTLLALSAPYPEEPVVNPPPGVLLDRSVHDSMTAAMTLVMWDADSVDAAAKDGQALVHPVRVILKEEFPATLPGRP
jgi:hypothetical protein